ncbi:hypothetical protein F5B22DRAFT_199883 [Xylaria bambusicola]|uniref:uncharacterized protein n=1 Tax=Xylaria bambusicola TaxID=326684 RepID=UPI002008E72A|nr:uncharacterized protein F5B22DRAFT_199883 [Xylaria bambusicola]KAI0515058.1 hypothetical protein F5B22DRAFT_199883 [Xylaria bambusicola]
MSALTTLFTPSPWCSDRFAVFVDDDAPGTSTMPPSSGWIDPSFTKCIPAQYSTAYPTFSPGFCPANMEVVRYAFNEQDHKTIWTAACCQSGFSPLSDDSDYLCTSSVTTPMAFLLDPNITTADVYTTLAPEWIMHDQVTVQWEQSDLEHFPSGVASQYKYMMDLGEQIAAVTSSGVTFRPALQTVTLPPTTTVTTSVLWPTPGWDANLTTGVPTNTKTNDNGGLTKTSKLIVAAAMCFAMAISITA